VDSWIERNGSEKCKCIALELNLTGALSDPIMEGSPEGSSLSSMKKGQSGRGARSGEDAAEEWLK
jgi:hypothetical protein